MNNRYKPEIIKWDVDWNLIKDGCMETISKRADKEPSEEWEQKLLISGHSPIRRGNISIRWSEIPSYVATHYCRHHIGVEKFVSSRRDDRVNDGIPRSQRPQTEMVSMQMDMNIQSLINICEMRLCTQADPETRKYCEGLVEAISEYDRNIAMMLVPRGIRYAGCPETFSDCNMCTNFLQTLSKEELLDLHTRLTEYQNYKDKTRTRR